MSQHRILDDLSQEKNEGQEKQLPKKQKNTKIENDHSISLMQGQGESDFDETSVFNEVKQKLGLQDIDTNSQTYKDLIHYLKNVICYPSTKAAQLHRQCSKFKIYIPPNKSDPLDAENNSQQIKESKGQKENNEQFRYEYCKCCGVLKQDQQLSICKQSEKDIGSAGISMFMFYRTMINSIIKLSLVLLIFGIYTLTTNIMTYNLMGDKIIPINSDTKLKEVAQKLISFASSVISSGSKINLSMRDSDDETLNTFRSYLAVQAWLGVVIVLALLLAEFLIQKIQIREVNKLKALHKSASDFTIVFRAVNMNVTKKNIQQLILSWVQLPQNKFSKQDIDEFTERSRLDSLIAKFNVGIPIDHPSMLRYKSFKENIPKIIKEENQFKKKVVGWIEELPKASQKTQQIAPKPPEFKTPQKERKRIEQDFNAFRRQNLTTEITEIDVSKDQERTDVFVTFESRKIKEKFLKSIIQQLFSQKLRTMLSKFFIKTPSIVFNSLQDGMCIDQAPLPEEIIWDNIGYSNAGYRFFNRFNMDRINNGILLATLGVSFGIIYGLLRIKQDYKQTKFAIFFPALIWFYNKIVQKFLWYLNKLEIRKSYNRYQNFLAFKICCVQLLNIIIIPIAVHHFMKSKTSYKYGNGEIDEEIFYLGLINMLIPPLFKIIDPFFAIYHIKVWWYSKPSKKFQLTQKQLNQYYELMQFQASSEYPYVINLYLFTCFYMSLQPILIIFAIVGYFLNYLAQKYCLFHRCKQPIPDNKDLYNFMVQMISYGGIFYSWGSFYFLSYYESISLDDTNFKTMSLHMIANITAIVVSHLPVVYMFFRDEQDLQDQYERSVLNRMDTTDESEDRLFSQERVFLRSEYDRMNPVTKQNALKDYFSFLQQEKKKLSKKSPEEKKMFKQRKVYQAGAAEKNSHE